MKERKIRSLLKAISWRIIAFTITSSLAYLFTHKPVVAVSIGFLDSLVKILAYFIHERVWVKIPFGVDKHPLEEIKLSKELSEEDKRIIIEKLKELGYIDD